ncbi:MAG TPA: phosphatidylserine decarboxylase family protein [Oligoflexia bacterium]|nr:phosphatidylserine decarboxylase family protein [Oligoflexia bacterium]HMR25622.1 phosphatidylserine decarboxylase family protein [Oligoflexia bacterium]
MKQVQKLERFLGICVEGFPFIGIAVLLTAIVSNISCVLSYIMVALTVWVIWFFRDPVRKNPIQAENQDSTLLCPADGTVIKIEPAQDLFAREEMQKVSIFMSVFNVHVNRSPITGSISKMEYRPGKFFAANLDKSSTDNERLAIEMQTAKFGRIVFAQIAGLVARRIVCAVKEGQSMAQGERFGMIRFGSRMDVYMSHDAKIKVKLGDKVKAGQTILATKA